MTALHTQLKEAKQHVADLKARKDSLSADAYNGQLSSALEEVVRLQDQLIFFPSGLSGAVTPANASESPDRAGAGAR